MQHPPHTERRRGYILLDRDGTIIHERHYLSDPAGVELLPNAAAGLARMSALGYGLIVVTNQSGIGRGLFSATALAQVHARMSELLLAEGVVLDAVYVCPHHPDDHCTCRKPLPGLAEQAARDFSLSLSLSAAPGTTAARDSDPRPRLDRGHNANPPVDLIVIGDKPADIGLGQSIGATTMLVRTGYGTQSLAAWPRSEGTEIAPLAPPDHIVTDLADAATILAGIASGQSSAA